MRNRISKTWILTLALFSGIASASSVSSLEASCNQGSAEACGKLALAYEEGQGTKQSLEQASRYYKIACEKGRARACAGFARTHMAKARQESWKYAEKACKEGIGNGCRYQAYILEQAASRSKNHETQVDNLLKKGCDLKDNISCLRMAVRLTRSSKTLKGSGQYLDKACEYGNKVACEKRKRFKKPQNKR